MDKLRMLVALTSYGEKNLDYLNTVVRGYRELPLQVRILVFSDAPKDLGPGVEVIVGLPSKNPWSLGFAHKAVFAQEAGNYDLFAYSEDDVLFTKRNLEAFLGVTPELPPNEIAGFMHYERDNSGEIWMVNVHRHFHWKPESTRRRNSCLVAEFTNEHSAFYLLTQNQLKQAIASGGFLRSPYQGKYDMLCAAATDPYTGCGFSKVICVSDLDDFLLHHLPNRYVSQLDVSLPAFKEQIRTLIEIHNRAHPPCSLFNESSDSGPFEWRKSYYEKPNQAVLNAVPCDAETVLSIGCGWGETERWLMQRGALVTALPLDSVIGAVAARKGVEVIYGTWADCTEQLGSRRFDCVVMTDLLHLQPDPGKALKECSRFVREGGVLILGGPNFQRLPWLIKRMRGIGRFRAVNGSDGHHLSLCGPASLKNHLRGAGLTITRVRWLNHTVERSFLRTIHIPFGRLTARNWMLQAHREIPS